MTDSNLALRNRIDRLETTQKRLLAALAMIGLVGLLAAASRPDVSRASAFQLLDAKGMVRAELGFRDDGVGLFLKDEEGKDRLRAIHDAGGVGLFLDDEKGTNRVGVAQFAHGGGGVALHGPESKGAAVLYLKGEGSLRFFDAEGNVTSQVLGKAPETR